MASLYVWIWFPTGTAGICHGRHEGGDFTAEYNAPHADLREFIERVERAGELLRIQGASWDLEMAALAEVIAHKRLEAPAVLFEDIPGYPQACAFSRGAQTRRSAWRWC